MTLTLTNAPQTHVIRYLPTHPNKRYAKMLARKVKARKALLTSLRIA